MNVTVTKLPKSQVKIEIEVPEESLVKYRNAASNKLAQKVRIPGFRQGKVPYEVLKQQVGDEMLRSFLIDEAIGPTYADAVIKENLQIVSRPTINITSVDPFKYEAIVAIKPEVVLGDLEKIKIPVQEVKVEEKDIDEVIDSVRKRNATFKDVESCLPAGESASSEGARAVQKGDRAEVSFKGFDEAGIALEGTESKRHPVIIGEGMMIPGFEDELIGLKKDEKKEFWITFPAEYHKKSFQSKKVRFEVEMLRIEERELPEITEDFIEKITGKKQTQEEFRKSIEQDLRSYREDEERERRKNLFIEELVKSAKMEIPDQLIEEELDFIMDDLKHSVSHRGIGWEKFEEMMKAQGKDLREENRPEADKRVKVRLSIGKAFEVAEIEITEDEIEAEIERTVGLQEESEKERIHQLYEGKSEHYHRLTNRLRLDKLFAKYLQNKV